MDNIIDFAKLGLTDLDQVGGKNASLGEMIQHVATAGVKVPGGFATTAAAFNQFLHDNHLTTKINSALSSFDIDDLTQLSNVGTEIRQWIMQAKLPTSLEQAIVAGYHQFSPKGDTAVAVRSSATSEDLPNASFAGQQETFLNVVGIDNVLLAVKKVFASLYNDRAISYRQHQGFERAKIAISAGVQQMVRTDCGVSGVVFTLDTESGFDQVILITASYGLGEAIVGGLVNPDEFYVYKSALRAGRPAILRRNLGQKACKIIYGEANEQERVKTVDVAEAERLHFCMSDEDVEKLARLALAIEDHYGRPMDIEWGIDGIDGEIYILQARPETVNSQKQHHPVIEQFTLEQEGTLKATGRSIGQKIGQGNACLIASPDDMRLMKKGEVLVTDMTDPDWEPIMKIASAIVTNRGGRTCHAAIIARELGIPAVVGCGDATKNIVHGEPITVSCAQGDAGFVYAGLLPYKHQQVEVGSMPELPFKLLLNLGNPDKAFSYQSLPNQGVGLTRIEFIISNMIGIHPRALLELASLPPALQHEIKQRTAAYSSPKEFYIEKLKEGIATIAAAFYPKPVIVRLSDFKSNEYANLLGGSSFEPDEENPMIGFRGASRYIASQFRDSFALECEAMKRVRNDMGLTNAQVMIPFVRTVNEAREVVDLLASLGLRRGENDLKLIMMCEIPSNALLAEEFLAYFDGFSIGSNDLTQLTLGLDRDSSLVAATFDERNPAVKALLHLAISTCRRLGKSVGICGQGPSDHPDLAKWLAAEGIHSLSLSPDSIIKTWLYLAEAEKG